MPYGRSQEGPPVPGVGARPGWSRLQQERPEQAQGLRAQAGGLMGTKEGSPGGLPGWLGPRGSPDSGGDAQRGAADPQGLPSLPGKELGTRSANLWTAQLWREAASKGEPGRAPALLPGPPPPSSVQPLLVTVGRRQEGNQGWARGPCSLPRSPRRPPDAGEAVSCRSPCLSAVGRGRGTEQSLCLCPPQAKAPGRTRPGPEIAVLLLATATAARTVLSARVESEPRRAWPNLTEQAQTRLSLCCSRLHHCTHWPRPWVVNGSSPKHGSLRLVARDVSAGGGATDGCPHHSASPRAHAP